jgi:signal peptidase I
MTQPALSEAQAAHLAQTERQRAIVGRWARMVLVAGLVALALRSFVYAPINIPSESMLPRLLVGDYVFVAKWPYGIGRYSLPLGLPLFEGRIGGDLPARGDIIVFKTPRDNRTDYIKRVIGLPGESVAMQDGRIILNGTAIPQVRQGDFTFNASGVGCDSGPGRPDFHARDAAGHSICRYPTFAETLPGGRQIAVIDQIAGDVRDDMAVQTVPPGHVFVMGDNRDDSADSRFTLAEGGVGMVPIDNIIGRADRIFFSVEPGPGALDPRNWLAAIRRDRIGQPL